MATIPAETRAMHRALELAATAGVPLGPNPRVGCVLLDPAGHSIAEGFHRGAGNPHAEVEALAGAGDRARGSTAVVTLEPCNHTGRTGPCSRALIEAGVARVVVAQLDPNPVARGGTEVLRAAGVDVEHGLLEAEAAALNRAWRFGLAHGRPMVTWKYASTLDGRSAAADGTSRWVSNTAARAETHALRARCDVVLVGTNTVALDDPHLTVRDSSGRVDGPQPLRAVMGTRELAPDARVFDSAAPTLRLTTHAPAQALAELFDLGRRHVFLEGGPTVAAAFLGAGLVDEVVAFIAPTLLGTGTPAVGDLGITTMAEALRLQITDLALVDSAGEQSNVRLTLTPGGRP